IKKGEISYTDLGLDHEPMPGESLDTPILDVSTKLEHIDRYIKWDEAAAISGLGPEGIENVKKMILKINTVITKECFKAGIDNIDGKFEFGIDENGEIIVVDVLGTPDECRFFAEDFHISKEAARRYYRDTQWAQDAEKAKTQYGDDWKEHVKTSPTPLPAEMKELLSRMYKAVANDITDRKFFEVPDLSSTIKELKKYAG
ncbi:MAG: phosphoribosylaminoimidazolesuccinocarboxamide synthase, partial [bacterium]